MMETDLKPLQPGTNIRERDLRLLRKKILQYSKTHLLAIEVQRGMKSTFQLLESIVNAVECQLIGILLFTIVSSLQNTIEEYVIIVCSLSVVDKAVPYNASVSMYYGYHIT